MAEHIQKIQDRDYVRTVPRSGRQDGGDDDAENSDEAPAGRGGRGGRGSRGGARGRGGRRGAAAPQQARGGGVMEFIPTRLGVALIEGFDRMNFETSLGKPFLRKEMELKMKAICDGYTTKQVVLHESISQYRRVYYQSQENLNVLKAVRAHPPHILLLLYDLRETDVA
ncbi:DNA topoisomerase III [Apiospora aurea]|uniref:DNA topoisomerase n=1 Tax=Apiospora aurea TaxID=335848 RepID=A0ABR1PWY6_9PEZI